MAEEPIPGGYTEIKVLSDTMIEAWYQCADPRFPCPSGNTTWKEFSRTTGPLGSHGGCTVCLMTGIVWIKILPAYREAALVSCIFPVNVIAGQTYQVTITVNQGSLTENYKLVFSGDLAGESIPFTVNAGTGQQQFTYGTLTFVTGGSKTVTAALVKI